MHGRRGARGVLSKGGCATSMRYQGRLFTLTCCGVFCLSGALFASLLASGARAASDKPQRIVSLNLCVDQILIDLVAKERIAALSFLATDRAMSAVAKRADTYPRVRGAAEGVVALNPDLVIAGSYSTLATRSLLHRLGKRVVVVTQPATIDGVRGLISNLAELVGEPERGRQMTAAFDQRLQKATDHAPSQRASQSSSRPTALAVQVNSIVSMSGTLLDDAIRLAGLKNSAQDVAVGRSGRVPLEMIVRQPPDVLVLANAPEDFKTVLADNLRHPVLVNLTKERPVVSLPMWSTLCGTPYVATAVERLVAARRKLEQQGDAR